MLNLGSSLAASLMNGTTVLSLVGDNSVLGEWADQLVAVATEHGFPFWRAAGTILRGWVNVKNGDVTAGMSLLQSGLIAYRATGAEAASCKDRNRVHAAALLPNSVLKKPLLSVGMVILMSSPASRRAAAV